MSIFYSCASLAIPEVSPASLAPPDDIITEIIPKVIVQNLDIFVKSIGAMTQMEYSRQWRFFNTSPFEQLVGDEYTIVP